MQSENNTSSSSDNSKVTEFNINRKIFVGNISYRIKSRKLTKFFSKFGPVDYCYIVKDHIKKWSRGIAFVTFKDEESMQRALGASDDELLFDQRQMRVKPAELSTRATYWQERHQDDDDDDDDDSDDLEEMEHHTSKNSTADKSELIPDLPCLIDSLFDDVLLRIFSLLSWKQRMGVERVCWRWKRLVQMTWVSQKHMHFQNIFRQFQGKYCPKVKELDVSAVKMTDVSLRNLVSTCTNLHTVKLKRCLHISDKGVNTILTSDQPLSYLDLTDVSHLTGQCFKTLQCNLDTLNKLVLTNCYKVKDSSFNHLVSHSRNLEELYVNNCSELSGEALREICQNCSHLRVFHAAGVKFDTEALTDLKKLPALEELNLSQCQMVTDAVLLSVSENCKELRYLDIGGCHGVTDNGVISLAKLPLLDSINISYLNKVTKDSVIKLAHVGNLVKFVARATLFSDEVISELVALSPRLNHIDLSGCFHITNKMIEGFRNRPEPDRCVDLILGGTSVDWLSDDIDWVKTGIAYLNVSMHNLAIDDLRADRDIVLPSYDEENWDDEIDEYPPHPPLSAYQQDHVEMCNDWCDDDDDYDDDFLDNDDPLEYERWNMT